MIASFVIHFHHPFRLHPDRDKFFWDEKNREQFVKYSRQRYLPALKLLACMVEQNPAFRVAVCFSGLFFEQAELYSTKIVDAARELLDAGLDGGRVEVLDTTYYNSLAGIFPDPKKREFRDQIILHQEQMKRIFGIRSRSFLNTYLIADREIARVTAKWVMKSCCATGPGETFPARPLRGMRSSGRPMRTPSSCSATGP